MNGIRRVAEAERRILARKRVTDALRYRARSLASRPTPAIHSHNEGEHSMFYKKIIVRKHERALLFRNGDFVTGAEFAPRLSRAAATRLPVHVLPIAPDSRSSLAPSLQ